VFFHDRLITTRNTPRRQLSCKILKHLRRWCSWLSEWDRNIILIWHCTNSPTQPLPKIITVDLSNSIYVLQSYAQLFTEFSFLRSRNHGSYTKKNYWVGRLLKLVKSNSSVFNWFLKKKVDSWILKSDNYFFLNTGLPKVRSNTLWKDVNFFSAKNFSWWLTTQLFA